MEEAQLSAALKATNPKGLALPWAFTRRLLARAWGVPPWTVDQVPHQEIDIELRIMAVEHEAKAFRARTR